VKFLKGKNIPLQDLEREAELLSRMRHNNIIAMHGVTYSLSGTLESIITEYMAHGDLLSFLK
jgi:serine/threonine protein kinase